MEHVQYKVTLVCGEHTKTRSAGLVEQLIEEKIREVHIFEFNSTVRNAKQVVARLRTEVEDGYNRLSVEEWQPDKSYYVERYKTNYGKDKELDYDHRGLWPRESVELKQSDLFD